jgi:oleate hydratase
MFEFRRYLRKYLHDILKLKGTPRATRTRYTQYESIVRPITEYLQKEGIDFRLNDEVIDVIVDQESQPNSVTQIKYRTPTGAELHVTVQPNDLVFIQLGALSSKTVTATNATPLDMASISSQDGIWPLWRRLAAKTPSFGNPSTFSTNIKDSTVITFTVTLNGSDFLERLRKLVESPADFQTVIYLANSRWRVSLDIPCQPVIEGQPEDVHVIWGWALQPEEEGSYVKKPMSSCTGEEIMTELIEHLHFPLMPILNKSITIPCVKPLLTAPLLPCSDGDRPPIVPSSLSNVANLGQFVEMANETTFSMEYSVRSAHIAVTRLMGIDKAVPEIRRSHVAELLDLLS